MSTATSPSRTVQNLAESKDLDARISRETDALKNKIDAKNLEIATKTKDLNKLVAENRDLQEKLDIITNPDTKYALIIDQGGGSFSAYLFATAPIAGSGGGSGGGGGAAGAGGGGFRTVQLEKYKSKQLHDLVDADIDAAAREALDGVSMHADDGTLNDYSFAAPEHFPVITGWFAAFYKNLEAKVRQSYGEVTHRTVRQTGKIRARLMSPGSEAARKVWYDTFNAALGPEWDYRLLTNEEEARIEGEAFYYFNTDFFNTLDGRYTPSQYVGLGIGSSSTQAYGRSSAGTVVVGFDSTAGAKPTKAQKDAGAAGDWVSVDTFTNVFKNILEPVMTTTADKKVVVATNAVGFLAAEITKTDKHPDWPRREEFSAAVTKGLPVLATEYRDMVQNFVETAPANWAGNFLLGLLTACCSFESAESVMLEQKMHHGKAGLPVETSWVMFLAQTTGGVE